MAARRPPYEKENALIKVNREFITQNMQRITYTNQKYLVSH